MQIKEETEVDEMSETEKFTKEREKKLTRAKSLWSGLPKAKMSAVVLHF